jgi:hypothetical protein
LELIPIDEIQNESPSTECSQRKFVRATTTIKTGIKPKIAFISVQELKKRGSPTNNSFYKIL